MHNNYYYIRQVSTALEKHLVGRQVDSVFSQDRDELVLGFLSKTDIVFIRAILKNDFVCLTFPTDFHRARKNTVELFQELSGRTVTGVIQYRNDRSFALQLDADLMLVFKLHGNRSNVLLYHGTEVVEMFQNNIDTDRNLTPESLHRPLTPTFDDFLATGCNPSAVYPTLGKLAVAYLNEQGFALQPPQNQWSILQAFIDSLEHPGKYYVCKLQNPTVGTEGIPVLSLFPLGSIEAEFSDPLEAANRFYSLYTRESTFEREKQQLVQKLEKRRKQTESYLAKTYEKLDLLLKEARHEQLAHLLMANLHQIPANSESVELVDFYHNQPIRIKLKKDLSAQKNAEIYYRKAKNEKIEIAILEKSIAQKEQELTELQKHISEIVSQKTLKPLRAYSKDNNLETESKTPQVQTLFRRYEYMGYEILVGKNSQNNDLLTREYAWKEDLWLHAKDVAGSHVVIKYQSGKTFPEPVIEKAAQLAAFFSKRKNDTLCPVTVTPRKYVRKPKGLAPGAVIVDKEKVVLVEPANFQ
jgi:predicted ribosome quality control (RQC) complex YloA/Tae2 family protein